MQRFENKCECGRPKVAGAIACTTCYAEAAKRRQSAPDRTRAADHVDGFDRDDIGPSED